MEGAALCYQCSRCNRCGKFSYKAAILCRSCDAVVAPGESECPSCGAPTLGNIYVGKVVFDPNAPVLYADSMKRPVSPPDPPDRT